LPPTSPPHVVIIGAGSTGAATAHDLALRGLRVTVVERGEIASGATGRNHCLLHSGARYCVTDPESAADCIRENRILQRIWPDAMECNGGLFVALDEEDLAFRESFLAGCGACGIPAREIPVDQALAWEPRLNPKILAAVWVPDGVFEPYRLCLAFLASAQSRGATIRLFSLVRGLLRSGRQVTGVTVGNIAGGEERIGADLVINAAGAWAGAVAIMADASLPLAPCAGVMVTVAGRLSNRVLNRMNKPSDGDIVVPVRQTSIVGTTSWIVESADGLTAPAEQVARMLDCGERMLPGFRNAAVRGVMAAARPLVCRTDVSARAARLSSSGTHVSGFNEDPERALSRECECVDHALEGAPGLLTIFGGKTTTARGMAEKAADVACAILGVEAECRTEEVALHDYHEFQTPSFLPSPHRGVNGRGGSTS
jgi:glycerol-3-phosphate dehydrogenase